MTPCSLADLPHRSAVKSVQFDYSTQQLTDLHTTTGLYSPGTFAADYRRFGKNDQSHFRQCTLLDSRICMIFSGPYSRVEQLTLLDPWQDLRYLATWRGTRRLAKLPITPGARGNTVVKVLCYKSERHCFDPSWCQWIFHWHKNPSDRAMALGSTQPLTEMSTRSISWG